MKPDNACASDTQRTLFQGRDVIADSAEKVPQGRVYVDQPTRKLVHVVRLNQVTARDVAQPAFVLAGFDDAAISGQ
ncbi:hypothetical protein [Phaeovulum veldkampii]|uniref:hypothetical protein n=1 Tax=Phaeovulum veldkampii TaxID=33049 RepID=UPI00105B50B0|nr:hypothetical protein [Phaeovulum veldkampii]